MKRTWLITGATSPISQAFAHLVAEQGNNLILISRDKTELDIIASDLTIRHPIQCEFLALDLANDLKTVQKRLQETPEIDLFLGHSLQLTQAELTEALIPTLIETNFTATITLIHTYLEKKQARHRLLFLSSVAACRGRAVNALYGASKAAVEVYLEGRQQGMTKTQQLTIARLGFIDTKSTYGKPGIFYAASPKDCAKACLKALNAKKQRIYTPFFWRYLMWLIRHLPFVFYQRC